MGADESPRENSRLVFVSHAGVDREAALALAERIEASGLCAWIDVRDLWWSGSPDPQPGGRASRAPGRCDRAPRR